MSKINAPTFSLLGNRLCLDFANTIDDRLQEPSGEMLTSYNDLVIWSQQTGIVSGDEAQRMLVKAEQYPEEAEAVRQHAIMLREAIYRIFTAVTQEEKPNDTDLHLFNRVLAEAMSKTCITVNENGFVWNWTEKDAAFNCMLWPVVRSMADLLTSDELSSVHQCASETCSWLFLDTSKNQSRRWCDMKNCGNRAKVSRHYERKRQSASKR